MRARRAAGALAALLALALVALVAGRGLAGNATGSSAGEGSDNGAVERDEGIGRELAGELPEPVGDVLSSAEATGYESGRTLEEEGREVLEGYRSRGDCVLASAGYLDLAGRTWGCVTQGEGWVEICIVREDADGDGCAVVSWRMDAEDVAAAVEGAG